MIKAKTLKKLKIYMDPFKKTWENNYKTNCYAYVLGLDIPNYQISPYHYNPGSFGNIMINPRMFNYDELINGIYKDLEKLNVTYKSVPSNYVLEENEWKIAIFTVKKVFENNCFDFHFVKQIENGIWTHKQGDMYGPTDMDYNNKKIINPEEANISLQVFNSNGIIEVHKYQYNETLCLKMKK